jgi:hypothetical protein
LLSYAATPALKVLNISPPGPVRDDAAREERLAELMEEFRSRSERQAETVAALQANRPDRSRTNGTGARQARLRRK